MSKINELILEKKDEIEMEKLETGTNMDKTALSGILSKSKFSKKEEISNKSLREKPIPIEEKKENKKEKEKENENEKEIEKEKEFENKINKQNMSMTGSIKTTNKDIILKKYNSETISGYFTFNNNKIKPFPMNSDLERFDKKSLRTSKIKNNNIIKRVKEFVPAKEYLALLDEIDEDDDNEEINNESEVKNSIYKNDSKINKESKEFNNNNSENQNLKDIIDMDNKNLNEELKALENIKEINRIINNEKEDIYDDKSEKNNKVFDIYNIDINLDFNDKKLKNEKINELLKYDNNNIFNNSNNIEKINSFRFNENMKENRDNKFKKEFYDNFSIYTTDILFKYGEYSTNINHYQNCTLLLKKPFLYVLNPNPSPITEKTIRFFNPDISLIDYIEKNTIEINKNNYILKNKFNLSNPLLCINFNLLSCILLINKNKVYEFQIMILGTKNKFSFIINDKILFNRFTYLIQNLIRNTDGSRNNKLGLSLRNNKFYKEIYITPYEFEKEAKTGDLLLFKTLDICADCQRCFTCDNYDHVGLILNKNKKLYIFESTSLGKCSSLSWNSFKQLFFNLVYYKIVYRKLNYENDNLERKNKKLEKLEQNCKTFIEEIKGKDYYLSIPRFLCCNKPDDYEYEKNWNQAKGFCCSALVGAIYIKLGVMKLEKSVHSIRPGDYEQDRNRLIFEEGFSLGPEKILEFSQ